MNLEEVALLVLAIPSSTSILPLFSVGTFIPVYTSLPPLVAVSHVPPVSPVFHSFPRTVSSIEVGFETPSLSSSFNFLLSTDRTYS